MSAETGYSHHDHTHPGRGRGGGEGERGGGEGEKGNIYMYLINVIDHVLKYRPWLS